MIKETQQKAKKKRPQDETKAERLKRLRLECKVRMRWLELGDELFNHTVDAIEAAKHYAKRKTEPQAAIMDHSFYTDQIERHEGLAKKVVAKMVELKRECPEILGEI